MGNAVSDKLRYANCVWCTSAVDPGFCVVQKCSDTEAIVWHPRCATNDPLYTEEISMEKKLAVARNRSGSRVHTLEEKDGVKGADYVDAEFVW